MKYKPGDKFIITIGRGLNGTREICYLVNNSFYLCEDTLDALEPYEDQKQEAYQCGLNDAWTAIKKILHMNEREKMVAFGVPYTGLVIGLKPEEAIAKLRAYEAQEIHVGDEVYFEDDKGLKYIVTRIPPDDSERINYIDCTGKTYANNAYSKAHKTGRHFPEVAALLEKMKDNANV